MSSDVVDKNTYRDNNGHSFGCVAILFAMAAAGGGVIALDVFGARLDLFVSLLITGSLGVAAWVVMEVRRSPQEEEAREKRVQADRERYERQWYCFQCGEVFHEEGARSADA